MELGGSGLQGHVSKSSQGNLTRAQAARSGGFPGTSTVHTVPGGGRGRAEPWSRAQGV